MLIFHFTHEKIEAGKANDSRETKQGTGIKQEPIFYVTASFWWAAGLWSNQHWWVLRHAWKLHHLTQETKTARLVVTMIISCCISLKQKTMKLYLLTLSHPQRQQRLVITQAMGSLPRKSPPPNDSYIGREVSMKLHDCGWKQDRK